MNTGTAMPTTVMLYAGRGSSSQGDAAGRNSEAALHGAGRQDASRRLFGACLADANAAGQDGAVDKRNGTGPRNLEEWT
jgi:hypothetical protein